MPQRPATAGSFRKGKSGNPGGRPKTLADVQAYARKKTKANIDRIARLAEEAEDEGVQLRASQLLHEIGWGKPVQPLAGSGDNGEFVIKWME